MPLPLPDELCCQHLSGPNPDPDALMASAAQIRGFLDEHGIPHDGRYATQCSCVASAKHCIEYMGLPVFVCNPCLRVVITGQAETRAKKAAGPQLVGPLGDRIGNNHK